VAEGVIIMAQKAKVKIVLVSMKPTKFWQLNSWDKFIIPKPFGTINYYITDLIDISNMHVAECRTYIKERLLDHDE
jgi:lysophospholipid acyltransferase (LPLAT)-like uncharacterized protein